MLPAELWSYLPPGAAAAAVLVFLSLRWWKQRDDSKQTERRSTWEQMQDLIDELRQQRDHERRVKEAALEDNARLRSDLREALRTMDHGER